MRISRKILTYSVLALAIIAGASPASAAIALPKAQPKPIFAGWVPVISPPIGVDSSSPVPNPCNFVIIDHTFGTFRISYHLNEAGVPSWWHIDSGQLNTTWSANGKHLDFAISSPQHIDAIPETTTYIVHLDGTNEFATIPGYGRVYGSAGHITVQYDLVNGIWEPTEVKNVGTHWVANWVVVCAYLAP